MQKNLNIEKIIFKVVQIKFLAMHITNQKLSFDIFTVENVQNIFMEHDLNILMIFGNHFEPFNVFLAIVINIPQRLNTAFVLQGHIYIYIYNHPNVSKMFSSKMSIFIRLLCLCSVISL